ncbi:MAG: exodeoxyribonuclease VII large subunit [Pseudomonadota bacterium]
MSDLIDDAPAGANAPEFTVSEISGAVKRTVEGAFAHVRVRGELGRVSRPKSGHVYLDLKDERAVLSGVIWKGTAQRLRTPPEEGMEVVATGRLTTFPGQSRYQIVIEDLAPAGVGALMAMLDKRRKALAAEGLFDEGRKRPLPFLPEVIGVVTSPSGAVIRDILHRLRDRFPRRVLLWPVTVQGERSAGEVAAAIRGFNAMPPGLARPDVLIVARGGGSLEDLWGFNEEIVVRAAAESAIPLISAVGHETDTTLIDFAADRRAPTPTAAAEMAVPVRADLLAHVAGLEERRRRAVAQALQVRGQRLRDLARALPQPQALVAERQQRLDTVGLRLPLALTGRAQRARLQMSSGVAGRFGPAVLTARLDRQRARLGEAARGLPRGLGRRIETARAALTSQRVSAAALSGRLGQGADRLARAATGLDGAGGRAMTDRRRALGALARMLHSLGYTETLRRGFAVVRDGGGGRVLADAAQARAAPALEIEFRDGRVALGAAQKRGKKPAQDDPQGSLF